MERYLLDSSAIVKRYVTEPGSSSIDKIYDKAEAGDAALTFPLWNVGEVLGVLSERKRRGWLTKAEYSRSLNSFAEETVKLHRLRALTIIPITAQTLVETWHVIAADHLYEADALQLIACATAPAILVTSDGRLLKSAYKHGLPSLDVSK